MTGARKGTTERLKRIATEVRKDFENRVIDKIQLQELYSNYHPERRREW